MYLVLHTVVFDENRLNLFLTKRGAFKYVATMSRPDEYVVLQADLKIVNDIKAFVKTMFTVQKKVVTQPSVQEPTIEPELVVEPQPVAEPVIKPKRKYTRRKAVAKSTQE